MRSGRYARPRMEAAISCKFHCKRLEGQWRGYWPGVDAVDLVADVEERLGAPTAPWGLKDIEPPHGGEVGLLVARLHRAGPPPPAFMHVRDFAPTWEAPEGGEEVLTHLDLHGGNALRAGSGWKVIDPKGIRADRHADVWALIDPLTLEDFPHGAAEAEATAHRRLKRYAEAAEMDLAKARAWTRLRAGAEAEEVDDPDWASALRRMANALG